MPAVIQQLTVYRLSIPLRTRVTHAAAQRAVADPVLARVEFNNGKVGWGETLPRSYVTGETVDTVAAAISGVFVPHIMSFHADSFADALEAIDSLPWRDEKGHLIPAARAAVELALLDGSMQSFGRTMDDVVQWLGLGGFGSPGSLKRIRFSGVLAEGSRDQLRRRIRQMYWGGLRDFKLKVGLPDDAERLELVRRSLRRGLASGRVSLRADANGAWSLEEAEQWFRLQPPKPFVAIEQPLAKSEDDLLPELRQRVSVPILLDESLVTLDDARRLIEGGAADGFNIRISKCGGLLPSLKIAALARRHGIKIALGCMVGETSLLSAAALRFLSVCPDTIWAEGCFGDRLLRHDPAKPCLKFGYGGRPPRLSADGLGASMDENRVLEFSDETPLMFRF